MMTVEPGAQESGAGPLVTGQVVIAASGPPPAGATMHISLCDVSYADGPATTVAEAVIRPVDRAAVGDTTIAFALLPAGDAPPIDPRHHYAVQVWVDRDGDGRAGPGDLYNDRRYPVLTRGNPSTVTITLSSG